MICASTSLGVWKEVALSGIGGWGGIAVRVRVVWWVRVALWG